MRAEEFIFEDGTRNIIDVWNIGNYKVLVDSHLLDRETTRTVSHDQILKSVVKFPKAKAKFKQLGDGQRFWVYDNENNIALGMYKRNGEKNSYILKTVWPRRPNEGKIPVFNVA